MRLLVACFLVFWYSEFFAFGLRYIFVGLVYEYLLLWVLRLCGFDAVCFILPC